MTHAFFSMVVLLIVSGVIGYASATFLPEPFRKIGNFVAVLVAVYAVFVFVAWMLGMPVAA